MESLDERRVQYEVAGPEYEKNYFDLLTGGYVLIHQGHNRSDNFASEVFISQVFARQGKVVELVNEQGKGKQFDAMVNGQPWEFKELTNQAQNIANAVQKGVSVGKKQAPNLAYHINRTELPQMNRINKGIGMALLWDDKQELEKIVLVFNDGSTQALTAQELRDGQRFQ